MKFFQPFDNLAIFNFASKTLPDLEDDDEQMRQTRS